MGFFERPLEVTEYSCTMTFPELEGETLFIGLKNIARNDLFGTRSVREGIVTDHSGSFQSGTFAMIFDLETHHGERRSVRTFSILLGGEPICAAIMYHQITFYTSQMNRVMGLWKPFPTQKDWRIKSSLQRIRDYLSTDKIRSIYFPVA